MQTLAQEDIFFPQGRLAGSSGALLLSPAEIICWDQVGVSPEINIFGEWLGQGRAANILGSFCFLFLWFVLLPFKQDSFLLLPKGKSSLFEISTDLIIYTVCLLFSWYSFHGQGRVREYHSSFFFSDISRHPPLIHTEAFVFCLPACSQIQSRKKSLKILIIIYFS